MIWMISARQSGTYTIDLDFPDGDMDKIEAEDMSIDIGRKSVRSFELFQSGRRIKTEFLPKHAKRSGGTQAMYDLIMAHMAQICSEPCRDLIEALDPGVHQFEEIKISLRSGEPEARRYFWFVPCTRLFALDIEKNHPELNVKWILQQSYGPQ